MPPRSPTYELATPALEHHPKNYSPLNHLSYQDSQPRTVHFSDPPIMPPVARHSIATSHVPLLPSVASASPLPHGPVRSAHPMPTVDLNAAIEYHKNTAHHLRKIHDNDRKAWEIEKTSLLARIADLEFKLNKARDPSRRSSDASYYEGARSFRSDLTSSHSSLSNGIPRRPSEGAASAGPPIWRRPEYTPPVTRVFSHDDDVSHLPSISEDEPMTSLSKQVSPTNQQEPQAIPIEQIDKELDGITVKSTGPAVTSSFVKINSPSVGSPDHAPSPAPREIVNGGLRVDMDRLLSPLDEKLKRHAGHTPMAFDGTISTEATTDTVPSPRTEKPVAPAPTTRPSLRPSERSDSYFSFSDQVKTKSDLRTDNIPEEVIEDHPLLETEEDPSLKGPLMLDPSATSQAANDFLDQVDAKLMEAAAHPRTDSVVCGEENQNPHEASHDVQQKEKKDDEGFLQLKIRKSTNFGSAWGEAPAGT